MDITIVIPWRDSGDTWRRLACDYTVGYYTDLDIGPVLLVGDGRESGHFNRHAAYNRGLAEAFTDVILWNEADTLLPAEQIVAAAELATQEPGIVLPFTERHELDAAQTERVYAGQADPFAMTGKQAVYAMGRSIGQAGVTSRATIDAIGGRWDERFEGWGYDDNAAFHCFNTLAGPPRWVAGKGVHLYHQPAFVSPTPEQHAATQRNAALFMNMARLSADDLRAHLAG